MTRRRKTFQYNRNKGSIPPVHTHPICFLLHDTCRKKLICPEDALFSTSSQSTWNCCCNSSTQKIKNVIRTYHRSPMSLCLFTHIPDVSPRHAFGRGRHRFSFPGGQVLRVLGENLLPSPARVRQKQLLRSESLHLPSTPQPVWAKIRC
jgi:hypothetical protein